jgi:signal transduction histidine kinase
VATAVTIQLRTLADQSGVHLTVRASHVPSLLANRLASPRSSSNLVDNAVVYTGADGTVEVWVWRAAGGAGLTVTDSGPGIAAEDLPRVFDRFSRLDGAQSRACGGSGLGLAICKALVETHGGHIWAESNPERGSAFILTRPVEPSAAAHQVMP